MAAGHNALRGSGPGQKPALESALAQVGCPGPWPTGIGALQVCGSVQHRRADRSACSDSSGGYPTREINFICERLKRVIAIELPKI